ncbi:MAG: terminase [Candidatus Margulisbacteria bacterium]|jgi:hypothetical protein|nr:terminase [Candidatus Margulisiibacteriota bacterium]
MVKIKGKGSLRNVVEKYKPEFAEQVRKLALGGFTVSRIADFFEVKDRVIFDWIKNRPAFGEAIKAGRVKADAEVASSLYKKATGFNAKIEDVFVHKGSVIKTEKKAYFPPDTTAAIYWLKTRQPDLWKEKVDAELGQLTIKIEKNLE